MRQKCVLLGPVKTVDLINKQDGAGTVLAGLLSIRHDLLDLFDSGEHRRELDELRFGDVSNDLGQRCLARSWRSPEDDGAGIVAFDLQPQWLVRSKNLLLSHKLIQRARTHAVRKWVCALATLVRQSLEQAHALTPPLSRRFIQQNGCSHACIQ